MKSRILNDRERALFEGMWTSESFDCPVDSITIQLVNNSVAKVYDSFLAPKQGGRETCIYRFGATESTYNEFNAPQFREIVKNSISLRQSNFSLKQCDLEILEQAQNDGVHVHEVWLETHSAGSNEPYGPEEENEWGIKASYLNHGAFSKTHVWYVGGSNTEYAEFQEIMTSQKEIAEVIRKGLFSDPVTEHILKSFDKDLVRQFILWLRENPKRTVLNSQDRLVGVFIWTKTTVPEKFHEIMTKFRGIKIEKGQISATVILSPGVTWENWNLRIMDFDYPQSVLHSLTGKSVRVLTDSPIFDEDMMISDMDVLTSGSVTVVKIHNPKPIVRCI